MGMTNKELSKIILQLIERHEMEITEDEYDALREVAKRLTEIRGKRNKKEEEPSSSFDYLTDDPFKGAGW